MRARRRSNSKPPPNWGNAAGNGRPSTGSARRWEIWAQQAAAGRRPCFAGEQRFTCDEADCPWRDECRDLRAEWHR